MDARAQDRLRIAVAWRAAGAEAKRAEEIAPGYDTAHGVAVLRDNGVRPHQTLEALAKLRPVFEKGNRHCHRREFFADYRWRSGLVDWNRGCREQPWPRNRLAPFEASPTRAAIPGEWGLGPVYAIERLLERLHVTIEDAELVEINEAFAAQVLAVLRKLKDEGIGEISDERLNVNGGAIALGHPVGASGARLVLTALKELQRRNARGGPRQSVRGGGQGAALWLERL